MKTKNKKAYLKLLSNIKIMDKNNQTSQKKSRFNFAVQGGVSKPMAPGVPSSSSAGRLGFNAGPNNN